MRTSAFATTLSLLLKEAHGIVHRRSTDMRTGVSFKVAASSYGQSVCGCVLTDKCTCLHFQQADFRQACAAQHIDEQTHIHVRRTHTHAAHMHTVASAVAAAAATATVAPPHAIR